MVLQTDFFRNKFRRTNILFGAPSCRLRYFSKDKRKTLWRHCGVEGKMMRAEQCMWGGEKIENEIKRLVKILTKCKMKLKSRKRRDKMKLRNPARPRPGRYFTSLLFPPPFIISFSPPPPSPTNLPPPPQPQLVGRHVPEEQYSPAIPLQLFRFSLPSS